jgi:hypothetical protein
MWRRCRKPGSATLRWPYRSVPAQIVTRLRTAARRELPELVPAGR